MYVPMRSYSDQLLLHSLFLSLSMFLLLAVSCFSHAEVECLPHQRSLLLSLKDGFSFTNYSDDKLLSWTPGSNCCDWDGISCDPSSGHVIRLDLSNRGISGNISSSLFDLKSLQTLNLAYNSFDEPIPQSGFEKLTELIHLNLSECRLSGQIPIGISCLTRLITLDLSWNNIELGNPNFQTLVRNLSHLRELHFDGVNISSDIEWSETLSISLPRLQVLTLYGCNVSGILPHNFFLLRNWTTLDLTGNQMFPGLLRGFPENSHLEVLRLPPTFITGSWFESIGNLKYLIDLQILGDDDGIWRKRRTLPTSIWNLTRLVLLDLSFNSLIGTFPTSIGNLTQLEHLGLSQNNLKGMIPTSIGNLTQLEYLDLSYNNLIGTIPISIGNLTRLEYLDLSHNNLNGPIPESLFSLPVIQSLYLGYNQLSSQLNDSLHISTSLASIDLSDNQLYGTVELDMFGRLTNLYYLDLSNNMLSVQEVTDSYLHYYPKLEHLSLKACNLTKIPTFLRYQDSLLYLKLSNNRIHGDIPKWIWTVGNSSLSYLDLSKNSFTNIRGLAGLTLGNIERLYLHSNMLRGPIPLPISNLVVFLDYSNNFFSSIIPSNISSYLGGSASFVSFANNSLTGEIPPSICEVLNGGVLDLSDNNLIGFIPPCLFEGNPHDLRGLNLRGNQLQGIIPHIIKSCYLEMLNLHGNQLEGLMPRSLANCSQLVVLDVGNNNLVDYFPFWLGNVSTLRVLILRGNGFHGSVEIPKCHGANYTFYSLQIFDLSSNHFEGSLPSECFNNMKVMMNNSQSDSSIIELNDFYPFALYKGIISVTSKGEDITLEKLLAIYTYIDLSNNRFQGNVPDMIGDLQGLHVLNFSHNALTGQIPSSIGNLKQLESLDLSENHLSGRIPQELDSLSFLEVLNVSNNNLVGRIPQGTQFSTFSNTSFNGNPGLCGKPLSKLCDNATQNGTGKVSQSKHASSSLTYVIELGLSIGLGFGVGIAMVLVLQNIPWRFWKRHDNN